MLLLTQISHPIAFYLPSFVHSPISELIIINSHINRAEIVNLVSVCVCVCMCVCELNYVGRCAQPCRCVCPNSTRRQCLEEQQQS